MANWIDRYHPVHYKLATGSCRLVLRVLNRLEVTIQSPFQEEPTILVSNHASHFDPPILGASFPRPIRFLAKESLFRGGFGRLMHLWGQVPVRRKGGGVGAVNRARKLLGTGWDIGLFIEGTRSRNGLFRTSACRTGAATIAHLAKAVIVPVGIHGSHKAFPTGARMPTTSPVRVIYGAPLDTTTFFGQPLSRESSKVFTLEIARSIQSLLPDNQKEIGHR